jgi:hypothetical protein
MRETHKLLREAWLKDVGYLRIAEQLQLNPDMVKALYSEWTKESIDSWKR